MEKESTSVSNNKRAMKEFEKMRPGWELAFGKK
jgi:hypothetical protein